MAMSILHLAQRRNTKDRLIRGYFGCVNKRILWLLCGCLLVQMGCRPREYTTIRPDQCPVQLPAPPMFDAALRARHQLIDYWLSAPHAVNWPASDLYERQRVQDINRRIAQHKQPASPPKSHQQSRSSRKNRQNTKPTTAHFSSQLCRFMQAPIAPKTFATENIARIEKRMRSGLSKYSFYRKEQAVSNEDVAKKWIPDAINTLKQHQRTHHDQGDGEQSNEDVGLHALVRDSSVYCFPTRLRAFDDPIDMAFDEWRCSQLRIGELVHVRAKTPDLWYVESDYTEGWISPDALSERLEQTPNAAICPGATHTDDNQSDEYTSDYIIATPQTLIWQKNQHSQEYHSTDTVLYQGTRLRPVITSLENELQSTSRFVGVWLAGKTGWKIAYVQRTAISSTTFSRADILKRAVDMLNEPYGWGGEGRLRDCSRFIMDLFRSFGIWLPRPSHKQAKTGLPSVDVHALSPKQKKKRIAELAKQGPLLLYFKGHIMLYIGNDRDEAFAIHQISAYRKPCPYNAEKDIAWRLNRIVISSLNLGKGSHRRSLIERITKVIIVKP